jgi:hypothetical protein
MSTFEEKKKTNILKIINNNKDIKNKKIIIHKLDELFRLSREKNLSIFVF